MAAALTDHQVVTIRDTLAAGGTRDEAAAAAGIARAALDRHLKVGQLAGLRAGRRWRPPTVDPSPLEIRARAAALRARWPEERWIAEAAPTRP